MTPESQAEFFDRTSVPPGIQGLLDEWPEIDPGTARLVRAAVMSRDPRRLRQTWDMLNARAVLSFPPMWAALPCSDGMNDASITEYGVVSDCLGCQAEDGSWARTSRALALRRTRSLWARAIRITFFGLPARVSRRWKAAKSGLCRRTSAATKNGFERMPRRPPRTERLPLSLPLSRAIGARPASLLTALLERVPISGSSALRRATVRSATPLISRQARSSLCHSGSVAIRAVFTS